MNAWVTDLYIYIYIYEKCYTYGNAKTGIQ